METGLNLSGAWLDEALNRTIVGWKPRLGGSFYARRLSLNRTIVGWKPLLKHQSREVVKALNRTIVGWKRR